jgi:hypothetical protein
MICRDPGGAGKKAEGHVRPASAGGGMEAVGVGAAGLGPVVGAWGPQWRTLAVASQVAGERRWQGRPLAMAPRRAPPASRFGIFFSRIDMIVVI